MTDSIPELPRGTNPRSWQTWSRSNHLHHFLHICTFFFDLQSCTWKQVELSFPLLFCWSEDPVLFSDCRISFLSIYLVCHLARLDVCLQFVFFDFLCVSPTDEDQIRCMYPLSTRNQICTGLGHGCMAGKRAMRRRSRWTRSRKRKIVRLLHYVYQHKSIQ
jgi:hypothetical protein